MSIIYCGQIYDNDVIQLGERNRAAKISQITDPAILNDTLHLGDKSKFNSDDSDDFSPEDIDTLNELGKSNITIFESDKLKDLDKKGESL